MGSAFQSRKEWGSVIFGIMSWLEEGLRRVPLPSIPVEIDERLDLSEQDPQERLHDSLEAQSLEAPGSLKSDLSLGQYDPSKAIGGAKVNFPDLAARDLQQLPLSDVSQNRPQHGQVQELSHMREGFVRPVEPGQIRTISLPEECKTVFITYSVDTAKDMIPFTKFLLANGFQPAIDIFDNPIRSMDTTKWMDRYLNDKSVLIIVVISPQYKAVVEGLGPDEHCLHTKYIYKQIQNEFIQQGCLNFRLVPVLFPGASLRHVPNWLQSTKLYRWPQDGPDLLLRLFRLERYIVPPPGPGLTLSVQQL